MICFNTLLVTIIKISYLWASIAEASTISFTDGGEMYLNLIPCDRKKKKLKPVCHANIKATNTLLISIWAQGSYCPEIIGPQSEKKKKKRPMADIPQFGLSKPG